MQKSVPLSESTLLAQRSPLNKNRLFCFTVLRLNLPVLLLVVSQLLFPLRTFSQIQLDDDKDPDYYKNVVRIYAPSEDAFIALQRLARPYIKKHEWKRAVRVYKEYEPMFPEMKERIEKIIDLLQAPEEGITMINMGGNINSDGQEYVPILAPDMKKIYFTGRDREDNIGGEDIYASYYINNRWTVARPLTGNINTESNEFINSISADGNELVLFGNYENSLGRGDNFYVEKTSKGWSSIKHFSPPINSQYWDADAFLTADGTAVLFSSERPGGIGQFHRKGDYYHGMEWGNTDIYVCMKEGDGWCKQAINLGPVINTPYTERSPFLHPDGKTLYFSSDGHYNLGKSDVFKSVRLSDTSWTEWSEPVNLGKEINTAEEDWGYKITTDGKYAYFSTVSEKGFGQEDIYYINLPAKVRPALDVFTISGKVIDESGNPVEATIRWEDVEKLKEVGVARTDPETGEYFIALPVGKYYAYYADVKGFYSTIHYMDLTDSVEYKEVTANIDLTSVESLQKSGKSIRINNIFFDFDRYDLKEKSHEALNLLYKFMKINPEILVEINAYTDNVGSSSYNQGLSERRAQSVVDYLVQKGININRLFPQGFGEANPVATNDTDEGRALNRRVEFRLRKAQ